MAFQIPEGLNPSVYPLAWLVGRWQGNGHSTWAGSKEIEFGQQVEFVSNGGPYLYYMSQTWTMDEQGQPDQPLVLETGFWRMSNEKSVEVVMSHPEGWVEIWAGSIVSPGQIRLTTDVVARTKSADLDYTAGSRLFGNV